MSLYNRIFDSTKRGNILILDGGTGTELEKRGVPMDPGAWCGLAALEHADILKRIHLDYIFLGCRCHYYKYVQLFSSHVGAIWLR